MSAGELISQGADKLAQGFQNYQNIRTQDRIASGQLDALLQMGGAGGVQALSPDGQKLAQKYLQGQATVRDKLQLLGEANTAMTQRQQLAQLQQQQAAAQQATLQNQIMQARLNYLGGMMGPQGQPNPQTIQNLSGGQSAQPSPDVLNQLSQGGQGQASPLPAPQVKVGPPAPLSITDPQFQPMYQQAMRMTLGDPDKAAAMTQSQVDAVNKQRQEAYDNMAKAQRPTGNYYFKRMDYKDGMPQMDVYSPEIATGAGTMAHSVKAGEQEIQVPHGQKAPGPVISMKGDAASIPNSPYNTEDPEWQKEVSQAYDMAAGSSNQLAQSKLLVDAAQAYIAANGDSGRWNAIMGDPKFAAIRQLFGPKGPNGGTNPLNALQIAMAANTQSVLGQIRGAGGSTGGRILQTEYENTAKLLGNPQMDAPTIMAAAQNVYALNDRMNSIDQAYAKYREIMPAGKAKALAVQQFGMAPNLVPTAPTNPQTKPTPAGQVRVKGPDGRTGTIPAANIEAAKAQGFIPIQ